MFHSHVVCKQVVRGHVSCFHHNLLPHEAVISSFRHSDIAGIIDASRSTHGHEATEQFALHRGLSERVARKMQHEIQKNTIKTHDYRRKGENFFRMQL